MKYYIIEQICLKQIHWISQLLFHRGLRFAVFFGFFCTLMGENDFKRFLYNGFELLRILQQLCCAQGCLSGRSPGVCLSCFSVHQLLFLFSAPDIGCVAAAADFAYLALLKQVGKRAFDRYRADIRESFQNVRFGDLPDMCACHFSYPLRL